ncbi:hypothetical protein DL762_002359 [Monosporascus cannonballus]|uniref:DAGKc domain-containing protein n=1 Tax=Monosporascus cannonballus TaxID=155416 RepID=A0ABY0HE25_9PEZI|nr:hypothetical protein DL762_002359 [Monosporascus cannonballus]
MDEMAANSMESKIGSIKTEEAVFIRKRTENSGGYDVFSLEENVEDGRPAFNLARIQTTDVAPDLLNGLLVEQVPEYLRSSPSRKLHVLVSTGAGTGCALAFYEDALRPLLDALGFASSEGGNGPSAQAESDNRGNRYNLVITKDAQSIRRFVQDLNEDAPEQEAIETDHTVILLSGDGGIVELLNGKAPTDGGSRTQIRTPLVAVLPLGTGNALFSSLHKPVKAAGGPTARSSGLVQGLRTLLTGTAAQLPSFGAAFSPGSRLITYMSADGEEADKAEERADAVSHLRGAIVASYGFHSQLVWESDTPACRAHGAKRFGMVAQELLRESHAYSAEVEITRPGKKERERVERDRHAYVLATLVSNLEETFTISPASRPLDGRLRLVHFGDVGGQRTMDIMTRAYDGGKHVDMAGEGGGGPEERVGYDEIAEVRVTTLERDPRWRKVCVDGTIVEIPQGGSMTVTMEEEAHLRILVDRSIVS